MKPDRVSFFLFELKFNGGNQKMDKIFIPNLLNKPNNREVIQFEEFLPDLETLTPVRGTIKITHQTTFLEVSAKAEAIITLTCDRCLQQYNHRVTLKNSEFIWLDENADKVDVVDEEELEMEDLVERLAPNADFNPSEWIYQQLCLELPLRQLCDQSCPGIKIEDSATNSDADTIIDSRWASLASLKKQLS